MPKRTCVWMVLLAGATALTAGAQAWKDKPVSQWSAEDARQLLADSPWVKTVTPTPNAAGDAGQQRGGVRPGIGIGGIGVGMPGMGRRGGGSRRQTDDSGTTDAGQLPTLTLRWVSAMPVNAAQLIARELNAPSVDEDHYAIAVYGVPAGMIHGDPNNLGAALQKHAAIKRDRKKDMEPSSVEVIMRDDGPVIVYFFSRRSEITRKDKVEFDAEIGRLKFTQDFLPVEMVYQDKLEL